MYRHTVVCYKLVNEVFCDDEFMHLNFQLCDNERQVKMTFLRRQNYNVGKNILLNQMLILNNKIDKAWLQLSLNSLKIKCKELFLS